MHPVGKLGVRQPEYQYLTATSGLGLFVVEQYFWSTLGNSYSTCPGKLMCRFELSLPHHSEKNTGSSRAPLSAMIYIDSINYSIQTTERNLVYHNPS